MTKIIGLTGGIGSGKTTVARQFETLGVPVYIADDAAKKVMNSETSINAIRETFGIDVFTGEKPDRQKLAALVFNNPEKLQQLNSIIHPLVQLDFINWLKQHTNSKFIIKEAAILFESGSYKDCDKIITVTAPIEVRIQRVIERDGVTHDAVMQRILNQWSEERKIALSDYVIVNINKANTTNQIFELYQELMIQ